MEHDDNGIDLNKYRWHKRLLLLFAPHQQQGSYLEQKQHLIIREAVLQERDLLVFDIFLEVGHGQDSKLSGQAVRSLRECYGIADDAFTLLLIGKDGTVKRREDAAMSLDILFAQIDSMPMRQQEMCSK